MEDTDGGGYSPSSSTLYQLPVTLTDEDLEKLKQASVPLADRQLSRDRVDSIDIVVGGDYYRDFITGFTTRIELAMQKLDASIIYMSRP